MVSIDTVLSGEISLNYCIKIFFLLSVIVIFHRKPVKKISYHCHKASEVKMH